MRSLESSEMHVLYRGSAVPKGSQKKKLLHFAGCLHRIVALLSL